MNPAPKLGAQASVHGCVSVVIKTLNEEAKIGRAIASALAAAPEVAPLALEVVVADSCSSDRTVQIASQYPVRVVQLAQPADRGCGAGVQLGYAAAQGEWVYLMDGDMALAPGFLGQALATLQASPQLGGVGGAVEDEQVSNSVDRIRVNNRSGATAGPVPWLEGGGLYRRSAIESAGAYAADRNLKGYEEAELGLRLGAAGFGLVRLGRRAVSHQGHALGTWALLRRHWRSRRAMSAGVMLRSAWGRPWWRQTLRLHRHPLATMAWWLLLPAGLALGSPLGWLQWWLALSLAGWLGLALLKRDLRHAGASVLSWHYAAAAIVLGWFEPRVDPQLPLDMRLLHEPGPLPTQA